jgi:succinylarginine dihydrolase
MSDHRETIPAPAFLAKQADDCLNALIERWWVDHFPGSAVARDTAAWNAAHAAKEALKRLLIPAQSLTQATVEENDLQGSI